MEQPLPQQESSPAQTPKPASPTDKPHHKISPAFIVGLLIAIVVLVILLGLPAIKKEPYEARFSPTGVQIPEEVNMYTGVITTKGDNSLELNAVAVANYLTSDEILKVRLDKNAEIVRLVVPFDAPAGVPITPTPEQISLDDLQIGNEVTVYSKNNIREKISFTAYKIEVVTFR